MLLLICNITTGSKKYNYWSQPHQSKSDSKMTEIVHANAGIVQFYKSVYSYENYKHIVPIQIFEIGDTKWAGGCAC